MSFQNPILDLIILKVKIKHNKNQTLKKKRIVFYDILVFGIKINVF
jgi:hypothetical protein